LIESTEKIPIKIKTGKKGGPRPNSGRKKGSPNKVTAEVRSLAQQYGEQAVKMLAEMMVNGESEAARIAAAKEILDRAYGKATQMIEGPGKDGEHLIRNTAAAPMLTQDQWLQAHGIKPLKSE
jgi:hypothetical protein